MTRPHAKLTSPDEVCAADAMGAVSDCRELLDILPVLQKVEKVADVRAHLGPLVNELASSMLQRHSMYGAQ